MTGTQAAHLTQLRCNYRLPSKPEWGSPIGSCGCRGSVCHRQGVTVKLFVGKSEGSPNLQAWSESETSELRISFLVVLLPLGSPAKPRKLGEDLEVEPGNPACFIKTPPFKFAKLGH